jgi:hypothetical protein
MSFIVPAQFRQLPPVWEIAQPFKVDASNSIAFDTDPVMWARNHILALLLTNPGERVMRPNYGIGIFSLVFENDNPLVEAQVVAAINAGAATYEPNITVNECKFVPQPEYSGAMEIHLSFSVGSAPTTYSMAFTVGGTAVEVTR